MASTHEDLHTLGGKLDALDLTDGERSILHELIGQAVDDDVAGFASVGFGDVLPRIQLPGTLAYTCNGGSCEHAVRK